jgi:hypothetical protein
MFNLESWGVPRLAGSALIGENVVRAADTISSLLMRKLATKLGLEEDD